MAPAAFTDADLILAARVALILSVRPFADGTPDHIADAHSVVVDRADALAIASALRPVGRNALFAALRHFAYLAAMAASAVADDTGKEEGTPVLRLARHARGEVLVVGRLSDDDEAEDWQRAWDDYLVSACALDRLDVEVEEIIPALLGGAALDSRPLPASTTPAGRRAPDAAADDDHAERVCPSCEVTHRASAFRSRGGTTRYTKCPPCRTAYGRRWRKANPQRTARYPSSYNPRPSRGLF